VDPEQGSTAVLGQHERFAGAADARDAGSRRYRIRHQLVAEAGGFLRQILLQPLLLRLKILPPLPRCCGHRPSQQTKFFSSATALRSVPNVAAGLMSGAVAATFAGV
jgi:hypothetical protein